MASIARNALSATPRRARALDPLTLCEQLEDRLQLAAAAFTTADFFPVNGGTWNYQGEVDGVAVNARTTATAGPNFSGNSSVKVQTVMTPTDGSAATTDTRYYNASNALKLFRQDVKIGSANNIRLLGSGLVELPATVTEGQVVNFNQAISGTRPDGLRWTGTFQGTVTIVGLENIRTSSGQFSALRIALTGMVNENGATGWDAHGMISETRWISRGVGTVHVDYAEGLAYSDIGEQGLRYGLGLVGSSRLNSVMDLEVTGKGVVVSFGATAPNANDGSNFTGIDLNGGTKTRVFFLTNNSDHAITLANGNSGFVSLTGVNASDFVVARQPARVLQPGQSTPFSVRFDPAALGFRYATVSIATSDNTATPFTFDIRGTGILIGRIDVKGTAGRAIADGAAPSAQNGTAFGSTSASGGRVQRVFTITNTGVGNLNLTGTPRVIIQGANPGDFNITLLPATTLAPGQSTTFKILFTPTDLGARTATVRIFNNDRFAPAFTFTISGTGT